jgi:hypothetical protein
MRHLSGGIAKIRLAGKRPWARGLVVLLVIALLLAGLSWTGQNQARAIATPKSEQIDVTLSPTLPYYLGQDINQMMPIILGGAVLVLVILAGTIGTTRRQP